jgi:hypothetical protein
MSRGDDLFDEVGRMVGARPDWHYEPSTSPGGPPSWCLDPGGEPTLSVTVIDGNIAVYLPATDQEIAVDNLDALRSWIEINESRFLRP